MRRSRSRLVVGFLVAVLVLTTSASASADSQSAAESRTGNSGPSSVVSDWERNSIRTIYTENTSPIPIGVLYLGFTSLAMYHAVRAAGWQKGSPEAAAAVAAHDVLAEYFPNSATTLAGNLTDSLKEIPDGPAKQKGIAAGAKVATGLIESRADDGRNDASIVYQKDPKPGIWQPAPGTAMLAPWIGFVDPLVLKRQIRVNGPDPITSAEYAFDFQEVRLTGAATGADRTEHQTDTALFFNSNSAIMVSEGLLRHLDTTSMSVKDTARLFAVMHTAMSDALITCWRLKYDVGFWRPFQAIQGAGADGNSATIADPNWQPLIPNPPYSDYVSGHGCLTAPAVEAIRQTLGEDTPLTLHSYITGADRDYQNLTLIEYDAFHARIWGGLHFRDAMEDAYFIGHQAADQVLRKLR